MQRNNSYIVEQQELLTQNVFFQYGDAVVVYCVACINVYYAVFYVVLNILQCRANKTNVIPYKSPTL